MPDKSTLVGSQVVVGLLAGARIAALLGFVLGAVVLAVGGHTPHSRLAPGLSFPWLLLDLVAGSIIGGPIWSVLSARAKTLRRRFWAATIASFPVFLAIVVEIANAIGMSRREVLSTGASLALYLATVFGSLWCAFDWASRRLSRR